MDAKKHSVHLFIYDYEVLTKNEMIALMFGDQLKAAKKKGDEMVLSLTLAQLEDLTGWVAAESNHARSKRVGEELGEICDHLEGLLYGIKRTG